MFTLLPILFCIHLWLTDDPRIYKEDCLQSCKRPAVKLSKPNFVKNAQLNRGTYIAIPDLVSLLGLYLMKLPSFAYEKDI